MLGEGWNVSKRGVRVMLVIESGDADEGVIEVFGLDERAILVAKDLGLLLV